MEHIPVEEIRAGDTIKIKDDIRTVLEVEPPSDGLWKLHTRITDDGTIVRIWKEQGETVEVISRGPESPPSVLERLESFLRIKQVNTTRWVEIDITDDDCFKVRLMHDKGGCWESEDPTLEAAIEAALKVAHDS